MSRRDHALALYIFSNDKAFKKKGTSYPRIYD